jgi:hypothetical protein
LERIVLNRIYISLMALVWVLALGGCSMLQPRPPEEIIADRALAQARHLMNREYDLALTYVVPSYQGSARATFYEADFVGSATWTDASVAWVRCDEALEPDRCRVRLLVYGGPSAGRTSARGEDVPWTWETVWIKINGKWYQFLN